MMGSAIVKKYCDFKFNPADEEQLDRLELLTVRLLR